MFSAGVEKYGYNRTGFFRKHPVLGPILIFIVLIGILSGITASYSEPEIGVVTVEGVILDSKKIIDQIRFLEHSPQVKGIVIRVNSPGGAVSPSQEIYRELSRISKKMPVYTSISSVAASGGYYIAIGTRRIYANPGSITGSIGVIMQSFNVEKLMQKIGIDAVTVKSGKNKDIGSAFRKMRPEEQKLLQGVISDTHDQFVKAISKSRKLDEVKVRKIADGRIFTGRQALKEKLIDGLAGFYDTVDQLAKDLKIENEYRLAYPPNEVDGFLKQLDLMNSVFKLKNKMADHSLIYYLSPLFD